MKVITVAIQKGGTGKTTTSMAMATILRNEGYKVLFIDTDMQCNSTDTYRAEMDDTATLYDVLLAEKRIPIEDAIQHTKDGDIVAGDRLLIQADDKLKSDSDGIFRLQDALSNLKGYDYVIMDTNPALNYLLYNCLVASDEIVIPVTADRYGLTGLKQISDTVHKIKKRQNPKLKVAGILIVNFNEYTKLGKEIRVALEDAANNMETSVFKTFIRKCQKVQDAQALRMQLFDYSRNCTAAEDYYDFVEEYLSKEA